jgi:hypothetical protein
MPAVLFNLVHHRLDDIFQLEVARIDVGRKPPMLRSASCTAMRHFREAGVTRYDASSGPGQGDAAAFKSRLTVLHQFKLVRHSGEVA